MKAGVTFFFLRCFKYFMFSCHLIIKIFIENNTNAWRILNQDMLRLNNLKREQELNVPNYRNLKYPVTKI